VSPRIIAIGDIHGCLDALVALLAGLEPTAEDRLILLGDYVDRGPDSCGVLDRLLELERQCELVPLLGNHELMMMRGLLDPRERQFWLHYGGQETLDSYGNNLDEIPPSHLEFLGRCRASYETESHLFIHANYLPDLPIDRQPEEIHFWAHLNASPPPPHESGKTVIVGHTPQYSGDVLDYGYLKCVDTHCFGGGWLTALDVESGEVWQTTQSGSLRRDRLAEGD
jgi:serine/threonine protein phosphatase 1